MKIKDFKYKKKKDDEVKDYSVLMLAETTTHIAGIDLNRLDEKEKKEVKDIQLEYEEKLKPYMKSYRQFIKENILNEEN